MEWLLELVLVLLLAMTLFHALRLERALGVLQQDRAALEAFVTTFNSSTRQAEQGVERLHAAADGAGRQIARQVDAAVGLKDDLLFLVERGERLADRLDGLVRAARTLAPDAGRADAPSLDTLRHNATIHDQRRPEAPHPAAPDLSAADAGAQHPAAFDHATSDAGPPDQGASRRNALPPELSRPDLRPRAAPLSDQPDGRLPSSREDAGPADRPVPRPAGDPQGQPRLRSQAERDLLKALRTAR